MDWYFYVFYANSKASETLKCPLNLRSQGDKSMPYQTILNRVKSFKELDCLPLPLGHFLTNMEVHDSVLNKPLAQKLLFEIWPRKTGKG